MSARMTSGPGHQMLGHGPEHENSLTTAIKDRIVAEPGPGQGPHPGCSPTRWTTTNWSRSTPG